jgi:(2Fe-2S) ferredoxin
LPTERRFAVTVCRGPECGDRRGSRVIYDLFKERIEARGLAARCELRWQSCFGRCSQGPNVLVREITGSDAPPGSTPATALYNGVTTVDADEIVERHLEAGSIVRSPDGSRG